MAEVACSRTLNSTLVHLVLILAGLHLKTKLPAAVQKLTRVVAWAS